MSDGLNDNEQSLNVSKYLSGKECRTDASGVNENVARAFAASNAIYQKEQEKILNASPHSKSGQANSNDDKGLSNK